MVAVPINAQVFVHIRLIELKIKN